mmetsp:Transcript_15267/g.22850  ORF Transcript_15267/g.22850 Transcript_15267/m.22850 type:complete len:496 (+) Transcript_15267:2-1489(+)
MRARGTRSVHHSNSTQNEITPSPSESDGGFITSLQNRILQIQTVLRDTQILPSFSSSSSSSSEQRGSSGGEQHETLPPPTPVHPSRSSHHHYQDEEEYSSQEQQPNGFLLSHGQFISLSSSSSSDQDEFYSSDESALLIDYSGSSDVGLTEADLLAADAAPTTTTTTTTNTHDENDTDQESSDDSLSAWFGNGAGASIELDSLGLWFEKSLPYLMLLLILFVYNHRMGIIVFFWNYAVLHHARRAIEKQERHREDTGFEIDRQQLMLVMGIIMLLFVHICTTYLVFADERLWRSLLLLLPSYSDAHFFWGSLWIVLINGLMIRSGILILRALCLLANAAARISRQGKFLSLLDSLFFTYLQIFPIPVWFNFFLSDEHASKTFSCILAGLYLAFKLTNTIIPSIKRLLFTLQAFLFNTLPYGNYANEEDLEKAGDMCAICQEKMISPVKLSCAHVFCEQCISAWLQRERTCPLCRAIVSSSPTLPKPIEQSVFLVW